MQWPVDHSAVPAVSRIVNNQIVWDRAEGGFARGDSVTVLLNDDGLRGSSAKVESVESDRTVIINTKRGSFRYCVAALAAR